MANDKYVKLIKQYSEDGGNTWYDSNPPEYKRGDLIETDSPDCGAAVLQYRWFAKGEDYYTCEGYNKYYKEWYQYSYDGTNWFDVEPEQTRTGSLIEQNSIDCDYGVEWIPVEDQYICEEYTAPIPPDEPDEPDEVEYLQVVYEKNGNLITADINDNTIANYPLSEYTPIAILLPVVFPDGKHRAISLLNMSAKTPDIGTIENETLNCGYLIYNNEAINTKNIWFDVYNVDYGLENDDESPVYNYFNFPTTAILAMGGSLISCSNDDIILKTYRSEPSLSDYCTIPCGELSYNNINMPPRQYATSACNNKMFYYYRGSGVYNRPCMSTFDSEYNFNNNSILPFEKILYPDNIQNKLKDGINYNIFSYYNGKEYTNKLINYNTSQMDWKTASNLNNIQGGINQLTPPCCCWRFHTVGTKQGDWYLPSALELEVAMQLYNLINNTLSLLVNYYGIDVAFFEKSIYILTSIYAVNGEQYDNPKYADKRTNFMRGILGNKNNYCTPTLSFGEVQPSDEVKIIAKAFLIID